MPRKSDRREHESAMESLLPEVSLEEDDDSPGEKEENDASSVELQNHSSTEEQNRSTVQESGKSKMEQSSGNGSSDDVREDGGSRVETSLQEEASEVEKTDSRAEKLPVRVGNRPDLEKKLGPYVSKDVDDVLEDAYLLLRRHLGGAASKSLIVEGALRFALNDYLRRGEDSEIAKWVATVLEAEQ